MNRHRKNNRRVQGFTLIEVLVVIAIISVLITILLPSFNAARKKPYDVAALQCGKAIATAETSYMGEHNNAPATSLAALNNTDVTEQCAGIQVKNVAPAGGIAITSAGDNTIAVDVSNWQIYVWSQSGTGVYVYNKDIPGAHFSKTN